MKQKRKRKRCFPSGDYRKCEFKYPRIRYFGRYETDSGAWNQG